MKDSGFAKELLVEHKKAILFIFLLSCVLTFLSFNTGVVFGNNVEVSIADTFTGNSVGGVMDNLIEKTTGAFAPLVGMSGSPMIALSTISGLGWALNDGLIKPEGFGLARELMLLPISHLHIFLMLLLFTLIKFGLSLMTPSKIASDATLGAIENFVGHCFSFGMVFLLMSTVTVTAAEVTTSSIGSCNKSQDRLNRNNKSYNFNKCKCAERYSIVTNGNWRSATSDSRYYRFRCQYG